MTSDGSETAKGRAIEIENIGPNVHVHVPLPEEGGVVVLRGRNDIGKSEAIRAVSALTGSKERLNIRRDAPIGTRGRVAGGGVELVIGKNQRRKGDAEFEVLDGRMSVAKLVDPQIQNLDAADAHRIKALLSLSAAKPDATLFYELLGGKEPFESAVGRQVWDGNDVVASAGKVKRVLEAYARDEEQKSDHCQGRAQALRESAEDAPDCDSDAKQLQQALESAIGVQSRLKEQHRAACENRRKVDEARKELASAELHYEGPDVATADTDLELAEHTVKRAEHTVAKIEEQIRELTEKLHGAQSELAEQQHAKKDCQTRLGNAKAHERLVKSCKATIESFSDESDIDRRALDEAAESVNAARQSVERGALRRKADQDLAMAANVDSVAREHRMKADQFRDAAAGVDDVLSRMVEPLHAQMKVANGRLMVNTERGMKYFSELSHGARWKLALDIAIEAVGRNGLLPLPQEAWDGLDPINRRLVADHVKGSGVTIVTASASEEEEVTAEVYQP